MSFAYFNEFDPYAAAWLRNLMAAGLIPSGEVDERSIVDVAADDLGQFRQCHFFAGIGGWSLAARLAGWPDDREFWTGSAPCQPFSVAGQGKAQADDRHLWPHLFRLASARRPAVLMGEQVAAAVGKDWLDGVFADLEGIGYACGAVVVPACSVNAPHRRDRLWFVADASGTGLAQRERERERGILDRVGGEHQGQDAADDAAAGAMADPNRSGLRAGGREGLHRSGQQGAFASLPGASACPVADTDQPGAREGREQRGGQLGGAGGDPDACAGPVEHADGIAFGGDSRRRPEIGFANASAWSGAAWIIGHDGKARRVEPSIRLLAHGVPARVGRLRAYGNAIVPAVAAEVIGAFMDCRP